MKKKFPLFYKIYFTAIAVFIVALVVGVVVLRGVLADYEASLPQHEAERVFSDYFEARSFSAMLGKCTYRLSEYETYQNLLEYLDDVTQNGDLSFLKVSSLGDNTYKYVVRSGDVKFCSFTLAPSGEKSKWGFNLYSLDTLEILKTGDLKSVTVSLPDTSALYINGIAAKDDAVVEREVPAASCDHMPDGVRGVYYNTYKISDLLEDPDILIAYPDGSRRVPEYDEVSGTWTAPLPNDETLMEEFGEYVTEAAEKYAVYSQGDCGFGAIKKFFDPDSELYTNIRTLENGFVLDHSSWSFENVQLGEFYRYDENTFSCRISFVHLLHKAGAADYKDYLDMTLYLRNINGAYLIYDRYNN